jgi:hypothetical protein
LEMMKNTFSGEIDRFGALDMTQTVLERQVVPNL